MRALSESKATLRGTSWDTPNRQCTQKSRRGFPSIISRSAYITREGRHLRIKNPGRVYRFPIRTSLNSSNAVYLEERERGPPRGGLRGIDCFIIPNGAHTHAWPGTNLSRAGAVVALAFLDSANAIKREIRESATRRGKVYRSGNTRSLRTDDLFQTVPHLCADVIFRTVRTKR